MLQRVSPELTSVAVSNADTTVTLCYDNKARSRIKYLGHEIYRIRVDAMFGSSDRLMNPLPEETYMVIGSTDIHAGKHSRRRDDDSMLDFQNANRIEIMFKESGNVAGGNPASSLPLMRSESVSLHVSKKGSLTWTRNDSGEIFANDAEIQPYQYDYVRARGPSSSSSSSSQNVDEVVVHEFQHRMERSLADERYYGMGEVSGTLNKYGRRLQVDSRDALSYSAETSDPLYKHAPLIIVLTKEKTAYAILYDTMARGVFDLGQEISAFRGYYRYFSAEFQSSLEYYMVFGPTFGELANKLGMLMGRPALPPAWSLGYLGSAMAYTDMINAQELLLNFKRDCLTHKIPCDGFHLSSGYCMDDNGRRMVFQWNRSRIPNPTKLFDDFNEAGIKLICNIKPWLLADHPEYGSVLGKDGYLTSGTEASVGYFWKGGAGTYAQGSYLDFTNPNTSRWWECEAKTKLLDFGAASLWNDNNEYEEDDPNANCSLGKVSVVGRALQPLLMGVASFNALSAHKTNERPLIVSRSGGIGTHRYCAQTWSGDNTTSWHTMKWNTPMSLGLGLCGWIGCGADVGGFVGRMPTPELFVRWIQLGVFFPRFSIHSSSWKTTTQMGSASASASSSESKRTRIEDISNDLVNLSGTNEPWMFGSPIVDIVRALIRFRCRLRPTLQSLHLEGSMNSLPVIRPLVFHYQNDKDDRSRDESFEFLLGRNLLVVGVFEPQHENETPNCLPYLEDDITQPSPEVAQVNGREFISVYFPGDSCNDCWLDLHSCEVYEGGSEHKIATPISGRRFGIPVFLRLGSGFVLAGNEFSGNNLSQESALSVREVFVAPAKNGTIFFSWREESGTSNTCLTDVKERPEIRLVGNRNSSRPEGFSLSATRSECNPGVVRFDNVHVNILVKGVHDPIRMIVPITVQ